MYKKSIYYNILSFYRLISYCIEWYNIYQYTLIHYNTVSWNNTILCVIIFHHKVKYNIVQYNDTIGYWRCILSHDLKWCMIFMTSCVRILNTQWKIVNISYEWYPLYIKIKMLWINIFFKRYEILSSNMMWKCIKIIVIIKSV